MDISIHNLTDATAKVAGKGQCHWVDLTDSRGNKVALFVSSARSAEQIASAINLAIGADRIVEAAE